MDKPKMILFDYGGTLIYEPDFNPHGGNATIYPYINENPHNISLQEFGDYLLKLFDEIRALRGELIENIDPRFFKVAPMDAPTEEEKRKPFPVF